MSLAGGGLLLAALLLVPPREVLAQNLSVSPPRVLVDGREFPSALFRPTETIKLEWSPAVPGLTLKLGDFPGEYRRVSLSVSDLTQVEFTPQSLSLPVGVYYGILTNTSGETRGEIQVMAATDPSIRFSSEINIVVESPVAPTIIGPRGTVFTSTPTFEWEGIPGVPAYVVAVSSTPFELRTDPNTNDPVVEGLTPVWGALTTETSAQYGQTSPDSPFPNLPAPPLVPGREYYFTVVNTYSKTNVALVSEAFGGVVAFRYEAFTGLLAPVLTSPDADADFSDVEEIVFQWEPVADAASYTFTLTERQSIGGSIGDVPIFSITTPSTRLELNAFQLMRRGTYSWSVIPNEANGAAGLSADRTFTYDTSMGAFRFRPKSTLDGAAILGVRVSVENLDGRHAPNVPLINSTESYSDSLVVGRYQFHATREQYADTTIAVSIEEGLLKELDLRLRPLPARVSGRVVDDTGTPVENARVSLESPAGVTVKNDITDSEGRYSMSAPPGIYTIIASRDGYADGRVPGVVVRPDAQVDLADLVVEAVAGFVSGRVINESGQPVQLATVVAQSGATLQEVTTDAEGVFDLVLAAGSWGLSAQKDGFVGGRPVGVTVARGERISNVLVVLTERASQVSGTVFGVSYEDPAQPNRRALAGAIVEAVPFAGPVLLAECDDTGRFVMELGAGSYRLRARASGHLPSARIDIRVGYAESVAGLELEVTVEQSLVSGQVVEAAGPPIVGADVWADLGSSDARRTRTGPDGRFEMGLAPGRHTLTVLSDGFEQSSLVVGLSESGRAAGIRVVLFPSAGSIAGRVSRAGSPIARALVTAENGVDRISTRADDEGGYQIGLPAGRWTVVASAEGHEGSESMAFVLQPGQSVQEANFDLREREAVLQGAVASGSAPVSGAGVTIRASADVVLTTTRSDGLFAVSVPPGIPLSLTVDREGFESAESDTAPLGIGETRGITVEMVPVAASVSGEIRSAAGDVVPGAELEARQATSVITTTTGFNGRYELPLREGSYEIAASKLGFETEARLLTLAVGERRSGVDFVLGSRLGTVLLTVTTQSGSPLADAGGILFSSETILTSRSDGAGRMTFSSVPAGTYDVRVSLAGFDVGTLSAQSVQAGETLELNTVLLARPGEVSGRMVGPGGTPVAGALVRLEDLKVLTGADGRFLVSGVNPGSHDLVVTAQGFESLERPLSVGSTPMDLGDLDLIPRTATLTGAVRVAGTGDPISDAVLSLKSFLGSTSVKSDDVGGYAFVTLSRGDYTLEVTRAGFRRFETLLTDVQAGTTVDVSLEPADARIEGRILDVLGSPLLFPVRVIASGGGGVLTTTGGPQGNFVLTGVDPSATYTVRTEINRPGFVNGEAQVIPPVTSGVILVVQVQTASITGNAGIGRASIRLLDLPDGSVRAIAPSQSDGGFRFDFLPAGSYRVLPEKTGVTFSPPFAEVTVGQGQVGEAQFNAVSSVGSIRAQALNVLRQPIPGVDVVVTSTDGTLVRSGRTDGAGQSIFPNLPLTRVYSVRPSLPGFSSTPTFSTISLNSAEQQDVLFTLVEASGRISGRLQDEAGVQIQTGQATALHLETGVQYEGAVTAGVFSLSRLPAGNYRITVEADGYRPSSQTISLSEGQEVNGLVVQLRLASVILQGRVVYRGAGLPGVRVEAEAGSRLETVTDGSGAFVFPVLPLERPAPDTTVYRLFFSPEIGGTTERTVRIPGELLGQVVNVPEIRLPSGRLSVEVDDGLIPLRGAEVVVELPDGLLQAGETDGDGLFRTTETLAAGRYRVAVSQPGHLTPSGVRLQPVVPQDDSSVALRIPLPYRHVAPEAVSTSSPTRIFVGWTDGYDASSATAELRYVHSGSSTTIPMIREARGFAADIPALNSSDSFTYTVGVADGAVDLSYGTGNVPLTPQAPGTLASIRVSPALDSGRLRVGDTYRLEAVIRDGPGERITDRFLTGGAGTVSWTLEGPAGQLTFPDSSDPTVVDLEITEGGSYRLDLAVALGAARLSVTPIFEAGAFSPESITLSTPQPTVGNESAGLQLSYRATTEDGANQILGSSLRWSVEPIRAGTISQDGLFTPADPSFIGPVVVTVLDQTSGTSASVGFSLFHRLVAGAGAVLTDGQGTSLVLQAGSIPFAIDVGLSRPRLVGPKRNTIPFGQTARYTAGNQLVRFSMRADRALPNDSLLLPASLSLPSDPSLALFEGNRTIGRFDTGTLKWRLEESIDGGSEVTAPSVHKLSEFGLLIPNQGLGISRVAVLPNPFSPRVAPLRIGYLLTTDEPPASVSIRVFNVRGELVRTLLSGDAQEPGRYGSRTSAREIVWDGLTDRGREARNGRYVIEIRATDATGITTERISVVLVK